MKSSDKWSRMDTIHYRSPPNNDQKWTQYFKDVFWTMIKNEHNTLKKSSEQWSKMDNILYLNWKTRGLFCYQGRLHGQFKWIQILSTVCMLLNKASISLAHIFMDMSQCGIGLWPFQNVFHGHFPQLKPRMVNGKRKSILRNALPW